MTNVKGFQLKDIKRYEIKKINLKRRFIFLNVYQVLSTRLDVRDIKDVSVFLSAEFKIWLRSQSLRQESSEMKGNTECGLVGQHEVF